MKILFLNSNYKWRKVVTVFSFLLIISSVAIQASGHGGKDHGENAFTSLKALKKATMLYDKLISNQKIDQGWENDLVNVAIGKRGTGNKEEIVVSFHRNNGNSNKLYIFFRLDGEYAGSNITGE